ncbi:MAG: hypothetical protein ACOY0T_01735 [Myxococcota bacterium]
MFELAQIRGYSAASLFALGLLVSSPALAQQVCGEQTCPRGFSCETATTACPDIDCSGDGCRPCTPTEYSYCSPAPCQADSDCDSGMVCAAYERSDCGSSAPACDGADCPKPPADSVSCTTTIAHQCTPRWMLPCETAADCGGGFTCEEQQRCSCSGSGSSGGVGGGSARESASTPKESCSCEPSGEKACEPVEVACTSNADCAAGFTCDDNPEGTCSSSSDGQTSCTPGDPPKICTPPYTRLFGGRATKGDSLTGGNPESGDDGAKDAATQASGGGCSVAAAGAGAGNTSLLLAIGAALGFGARRRRR